ncbi:hypothetical protein BpHYR1_017580 [Brachionus plicatilis]|uniref:Transmembrane protein n=1 Tax=Brachionus plicatilis TaxID=10195 RepID=A0A3M7QFX5_BRAPC|nr:hypothetical protein BpHYR1_017580 [Brachionus plicatilis]
MIQSTKTKKKFQKLLVGLKISNQINTARVIKKSILNELTIKIRLLRSGLKQRDFLIFSEQCSIYMTCLKKGTILNRHFLIFNSFFSIIVLCTRKIFLNNFQYQNFS